MGSLEEVHMPQNGINYAGVMALASAMQHNPELCVLNLNDNTFTKRGALAMAQVSLLFIVVYFQAFHIRRVDLYPVCLRQIPFLDMASACQSCRL